MTRKYIVVGFWIVVFSMLLFVPIYFFRNYLDLGYRFIKPDYSGIKKDGNIVSILVLGKGGEGHSAPDLTDTIMNIYINLESKRISLVSLPRDIWDSDLRAKINSAYYWGKKKDGSGLGLATETVYKITGVKPAYVAVIDFTLFKDLVDVLGGIDVNVENDFVDRKYPIAGKENDLCGEEKTPISKRTYSCRYETITFSKGLQKMDGEVALKYVRSRNSEGDEGTDIAREARQQKAIEGLKNKLLSKDVLLNPQVLKNLSVTFLSKIETNIDRNTLATLSRIMFESRNNVQSLILPEEMLEVSVNNPKYDRQYVFISPSGNWEKLQEWIRKSI